MAAFKAQAHMRDLKQRLSLQLAGVAFEDSLDANSNPIVKLSHNSEIIFIKIEDKGNAGRVDGLGLPQRAYSPHKCEILQDSDTVSSAEARAKTLAACAKMGMDVELWEKATLPAQFDLTGASLTAKIPADEINSLTNSQ